jgi:hypothetical protein
MKRRFNLTKKLKDAWRRYFINCKMQDRKKWNKLSDLRHIEKCLPKSVLHVHACAGTFWLTWRSGVQTEHNEKNYWKGKIVSVLDKEWVLGNKKIGDNSEKTS